MNLLLDTHILLWWFSDSSELPKRYGALLDEEEKKGSPVGLSIMSLWEIAKLVEAGRISFAYSVDRWLEELSQDSFIQVLPLNHHIILDSSRLGKNFHRDPVDQLITATARYSRLRLMTVDERIVKSDAVRIA